MDDSIWPACPLSFLHDAARCLALVSQRRLRLDDRGRLQPGALSLLARTTLLQPSHPQPRSETQAPELAFLFSLLTQAGLIGLVDRSPRLPATAHEWLCQPAELQTEALRHVWWFSPDVNTRWFPYSRRQRSLSSRWRAVILAVVRWMVTLPVAAWTCAVAVRTHIEAQGLLEPIGVESNLPHARRVQRRRTDELAAFTLRVVLPLLGLIETRNQDTELHVRPTAEGAAWLRAAIELRQRLDTATEGTATELAVPSQGLSFPPLDRPPLAVHEDLHLSVPLTAPASVTFEVAHLARLVSPGPPARYRVTRKSMHQAVTWGYSASEAVFVLARLSQGALPPPVIEQLDEWEREMHVVTCEPGYRLQVASAEELQALRQRKPFRRRTRPFASRQEAWVSREETKGLLRYLRRLGYVPVLPPDAEDDPPSIAPALRSRLPLSQLLVALRTYRHLRGQVPGLAPLDLEPLEADIAAALTPTQLAGVRQLVESHTIVLAWDVPSAPEGPGPDGEQAAPDSPLVCSTGGVRGGPAAAPPVDAQESPPVPSTGEASDRFGRQEEPHIHRLQAAIDATSLVELVYADAQGRVTVRPVRPLRLEERGGQHILIAYCELRRDERHFRLDRIIGVQPPAAQADPESLPFPEEI